jgi:hypothetical protein
VCVWLEEEEEEAQEEKPVCAEIKGEARAFVWVRERRTAPP